jgi:hypothetical protein
MDVMSKFIDEPQQRLEIFSCDNGAEAQPAEQDAVPPRKGTKRPRRSTLKKGTHNCKNTRKRACTNETRDGALLEDFELDADPIFRRILEDLKSDHDLANETGPHFMEGDAMPTLDDLLLLDMM